MHQLVNRRDLFRSSTGILALPLAAFAESHPPGSLRFRVEETAGLRRFGYPVHLVLDRLPTAFAEKAESLVLMRDGKPVRSQIRSEAGATGLIHVLDFAASPGPLETEEYELIPGEPTPAPKGGVNIQQRDGVYRVTSGGSLHYDVPEDFSRLLRSVGNANKEYIAETGQGAGGLSLLDASGKPLEIAPLTGSPLYQGPFACALRFTGGGKGTKAIASDIRLHFPSSKSWVEAEVAIHDPSNQVRSIQLALSLKLEGAPTLVDLGANDTVYGHLKGTEVMSLAQSPGKPWKVEMGAAGSPKTFAVSVGDAKIRAEGWAHVMDRQRCTAAAVAEFGQKHLDRIETHANGNLLIRRDFGDSAVALKKLRFWFHFVPMPVQVGAVTSPQAMLAPLKTIWI